eukprot:TRINITY_DN177_c0_g1_i6.p1 TRINITY_DN177_c0_g1~~TRINITY_DN177_c0_g1_i6.p1  ORF type:complete len:135 (-),score=42.39 TRINITY_DN177_c0_g1_i6:90-437(-)
MSCGLAAPAIVYSAHVTNNDSHPVHVTVTYRLKDETQHAEATIAAGATHFFEQKTKQEDSAVFSFVIDGLRVTSVGPSNSLAAVQAPFEGVHSPTKDYKFVISSSAGKLHVAHHK